MRSTAVSNSLWINNLRSSVRKRTRLLSSHSVDDIVWSDQSVAVGSHAALHVATSPRRLEIALLTFGVREGTDVSPALSHGDAVKLQEGLKLLLSPLDYPDTVAWRRAICDHLLNWIHAEGVFVTLSKSAKPAMVGAGRWGADVQAEYIARWHNRSEIDLLRDARGLLAWVRQDVLSQSDFRRTAYFKEFCDPVRLNNAAGAVHRFEDGDRAVLHFTSSRFRDFRPGGRTVRLLHLLQPALMAGATALKAVPGRRRDDLDDSLPAMALVSVDGRLLHSTPELGALFSDAQVGAGLRFLVREVGCEAGRLLKRRSPHDRCTPSRTLNAGGSRFTISGTFTQQLTALGNAACVVVVTRRGVPVSAQAPHGLATLTARETDVAHLIANGFRNRDIAAALAVSEHTARRHTERVLRKLGVRSRAGVAGALNQPGTAGAPPKSNSS